MLFFNQNGGRAQQTVAAALTHKAYWAPALRVSMSFVTHRQHQDYSPSAESPRSQLSQNDLARRSRSTPDR